MVHTLSELLGTVNFARNVGHVRVARTQQLGRSATIHDAGIQHNSTYVNWIHTTYISIWRRVQSTGELSTQGVTPRPPPPPPLGILVITHHRFDKHCTRRMMRCARNSKELHTARKETTTVRPWRVHSPLRAGSLDTTPQHAKTNCVRHGLDHTR